MVLITLLTEWWILLHWMFVVFISSLSYVINIHLNIYFWCLSLGIWIQCLLQKEIITIYRCCLFRYFFSAIFYHWYLVSVSISCDLFAYNTSIWICHWNTRISFRHTYKDSFIVDTNTHAILILFLFKDKFRKTKQHYLSFPV